MAFAAVIFDFFGTLTPSTPEPVWRQITEATAAPLGISPAAWRRTLDDSFGERATGALGDLPATFRELARRNGVEPTEQALAQSCAVRLAAQRKLFALRPGALDVLGQVRARDLRVGVLSDCTIELAQYWAELPLAGLVDARVLSCEQGRRKPDPELFAAIAGQLGVAAPQCLYIGDGGGRELTGATRAGMHAVMLRAADWTANVAAGREDDWQGPAVPALTDVLALLGS